MRLGTAMMPIKETGQGTNVSTLRSVAVLGKPLQCLATITAAGTTAGTWQMTDKPTTRAARAPSVQRIATTGSATATKVL